MKHTLYGEKPRSVLFCIFRRDGAAGSSEVQIDVDGEKDAVGGD